MTSAQRIALVLVTFPLIAVAILLFALAGYAPLVAVIGGVWWGLVPIFLVFGVPMAVAPARMIRWREEATASRSYSFPQAGNWFSKQLAISGTQPRDSAVAQHRVRMMGVTYILIGIGVGIVLVLLRWI